MNDTDTTHIEAFIRVVWLAKENCYPMTEREKDMINWEGGEYLIFLLVLHKKEKVIRYPDSSLLTPQRTKSFGTGKESLDAMTPT